MKNDYLKLCLLTHAEDLTLPQYQQFILDAVKGGVTSIQLREKNADSSRLLQMACMLKEVLNPHNIPLIINDHIDLAKEIGADGIHLGQTDCSPEIAREILGPDKIIGWSIESLDELKIANESSCIDYVAASAVFPSQTKTNCNTIWGLSGLREMVRHSRHPVIAIGGIDASNVRQVMEQGARGVAVISTIHAHAHPGKAAAELIKLICHPESARSVIPAKAGTYFPVDSQ